MSVHFTDRSVAELVEPVDLVSLETGISRVEPHPLTYLLRGAIVGAMLAIKLTRMADDSSSDTVITDGPEIAEDADIVEFNGNQVYTG